MDIKLKYMVNILMVLIWFNTTNITNKNIPLNPKKNFISILLSRSNNATSTNLISKSITKNKKTSSKDKKYYKARLLNNKQQEYEVRKNINQLITVGVFCFVLGFLIDKYNNKLPEKVSPQSNKEIFHEYTKISMKNIPTPINDDEISDQRNLLKIGSELIVLLEKTKQSWEDIHDSFNKLKIEIESIYQLNETELEISSKENTKQQQIIINYKYLFFNKIFFKLINDNYENLSDNNPRKILLNTFKTIINLNGLFNTQEIDQKFDELNLQNKNFNNFIEKLKINLGFEKINFLDELIKTLFITSNNKTINDFSTFLMYMIKDFIITKYNDEKTKINLPQDNKSLSSQELLNLLMAMPEMSKVKNDIQNQETINDDKNEKISWSEWFSDVNNIWNSLATQSQSTWNTLKESLNNKKTGVTNIGKLLSFFGPYINTLIKIPSMIPELSDYGLTKIFVGSKSIIHQIIINFLTADIKDLKTMSDNFHTFIKDEQIKINNENIDINNENNSFYLSLLAQNKNIILQNDDSHKELLMKEIQFFNNQLKFMKNIIDIIINIKTIYHHNKVQNTINVFIKLMEKININNKKNQDQETVTLIKN